MSTGVSRRFSTGDLRIKPTDSYNAKSKGIKTAYTSRQNSPKFSTRSNNNSSRRRSYDKISPNSSPFPRAKKLSARGNRTDDNKFKVCKKPVFAYPLSKSQEQLEEELIKKQSHNIRKNPGVDARELRTRFPRRGIAANTDKMSIITNHIVLGSKRDASNKAIMDRIGITHILNMAQQVPNHFPNDYIYHKINILDSPTTDITESYASASSFISRVERVKGRVLVHCVSGVSRSVAVVIMHFIGKYRMHLKNAYNHIHAVRPYIHPNNGFKFQMAMFELETLGTSSVASNTAGEAWSFYEWNSVKNQYKHQSVDGTEGLERGFSDVCCNIS